MFDRFGSDRRTAGADGVTRRTLACAEEKAPAGFSVAGDRAGSIHDAIERPHECRDAFELRRGQCGKRRHPARGSVSDDALDVGIAERLDAAAVCERGRAPARAILAVARAARSGEHVCPSRGEIGGRWRLLPGGGRPGERDRHQARRDPRRERFQHYFTPNAYTNDLRVVTYTWPSATVTLLRCVQSSMAVPLENSSSPVSGSSA